jgi:hypothetical protein
MVKGYCDIVVYSIPPSCRGKTAVERISGVSGPKVSGSHRVQVSGVWCLVSGVRICRAEH